MSDLLALSKVLTSLINIFELVCFGNKLFNLKGPLLLKKYF